ncbi:hypothetical protein C1637_04110 [Chryseobacterium lactis]|uniref:Uncharacterized protein n=1 Tax=Chryseobacterium lactis TaxID=1241981 RepID=A0A3G6RY71_CHRLC|nr:hypothetical protein [Chryseobacterium lactis]AZA81768.1 hypothetical protein EG342_07505 [Chryseobacterium lactis]AZB06766.1 hypothetical protein EG341_23625 [Chryseobacterium lactis]PNW15617.1 hypothetical protein C1637_04110 [Chryseobacterium lactis]
MKNYIIIYLLLFFSTAQNCNSQQNKNLSFTYERVFIINKKISNSFTYDSKSGIYENKQLYPDGNYQSKIITVNLTRDNVKEIFDLYLKLKPQNLRNCLYLGNQLMYSSSISFDNNKLQNLTCNKDENDEIKYKKIEDKLYEFVLPTYKLKYPNEFIGK